MSRKSASTRFLVCVKNDGYPASLEVRKIYQALADPEAARHSLVRVVDKSGEDYLYPQAFFASVELPAAVNKALSSLGDSRPSAQLSPKQQADLTQRDAELEANPGMALTWEQIRISVEKKP